MVLLACLLTLTDTESWGKGGERQWIPAPKAAVPPRLVKAVGLCLQGGASSGHICRASHPARVPAAHWSADRSAPLTYRTARHRCRRTTAAARPYARTCRMAGRRHLHHFCCGTEGGWLQWTADCVQRWSGMMKIQSQCKNYCFTRCGLNVMTFLINNAVLRSAVNNDRCNRFGDYD